jgi:tetrapyrrole methylase family protein / MazG family protein
MSQGIILLGLGPGDPDLLTVQAKNLLTSTPKVYFRTDHHPVAKAFAKITHIHSFDSLYESSERFEDVYSQIIAQILQLGRLDAGVLYAVPGHPFVAEATCPEIYRRAKAEGIPVQLVEGISFIEPVCSALGLDPFPRLVLSDALEVGRLHHPDFPPDMPVLFTQIYSRQVAAELKMTLNAVYPDDHPVRLVHAAGTPDVLVEDIQLYEIDRSRHIDITTAMYLPPLGEGTSLEAFQEIIAHLRAPDGCPWDKKQTYLSLRKHLLEETYETLAAMDQEDPVKMAEEFGDLLLQIILNAQIGVEEGDFSMTDILQGIYSKIIRRHPHVFGDVKVSGEEGVLVNWEKIKKEERASNGEEKKSLLDGVPIVFPALSQAQEIQDRAARVGFDWKDEQGVIDKMYEELEEVKSAKTPEAFEEEMGDLLFSVVNLARWRKVDAESALRTANQKFRTRFGYIETYAKVHHLEVSELSFEQLDDLWNQAKQELG